MTEIFEVPNPDNKLIEKGKKLRLASIKTSQTNNDDRIRALNLMADSLEKNSKKIIKANIEDYKKAENKGISKSLLSRLKLSKEKLNLGIEGVRQVGNLIDPVGQIQIKGNFLKV